MSKEFSFDVVSELDFQEVDNAVNQTTREIAVRYDLKNSNSKIVLDKKSKHIEIGSQDEFKLKSVVDILQSKLVKRSISLEALRFQKVVSSLGGSVSVTIDMVDGLSDEETKAITKSLKRNKYKVKVKIDGDRLRISSQSKDSLQEAMGFIKSESWGVPLQFTNYR